MLPNQLSAASFAQYPPEARKLATEQLALLQQLPLAFVPLLLRELIVYDWKFPAERVDLDRQFRYLAKRPSLADFAGLKLSPELEQTDWVNQPAIFSEQLSAHLWATHQIDKFRAAATVYVQKADASEPDPSLATHRFGIAVIGQGVGTNTYRLFRKLRTHGTYFTQVQSKNGFADLLHVAESRAAAHPAPYAHWYIDGGRGLASAEGVTRVTYDALAQPRAALQVRMQKTYEANVFDPEAFRTMLAQMKPEEIGLNDSSLLGRF
ncbi:MAG: hypothetical protein KGN84_16325, partial [Acidobacteriota bacterium]|nr:hypothetical protein [Acidobacteriota bacterium]